MSKHGPLREPLLPPKSPSPKPSRIRGVPLRLNVQQFLRHAHPVEFGSPHRLAVQKEEGTNVGISPKFLRRAKGGQTLVREDTLLVMLLACVRQLDARIRELESGRVQR